MAWQWHQLGHNKLFAPCCRQITTPVPHHSVFTGRMSFLPPNQQRQSSEGRDCSHWGVFNSFCTFFSIEFCSKRFPCAVYCAIHFRNWLVHLLVIFKSYTLMSASHCLCSFKVTCITWLFAYWVYHTGVTCASKWLHVRCIHLDVTSSGVVKIVSGWSLTVQLARWTVSCMHIVLRWSIVSD